MGEEEEEAEGEAVEEGEGGVVVGRGGPGGWTREEEVGESDSSAGSEDAMCFCQEGGAGVEAAEGSRPSVPAGVGGECSNRAQLVSAVDGEDHVLRSGREPRQVSRCVAVLEREASGVEFSLLGSPSCIRALSDSVTLTDRDRGKQGSEPAS